MWKHPEDNTQAIITAQKHIESCHGGENLILPETAILFYMSSGEKFVKSHYRTKLLTKSFPRFLSSCPVYQIKGRNICFLDGGRGAPQAVDTLETLAALGVKTVITVGMFGAFSEEIESGEIVIPNKAFVEEGTSLHYYSNIEYSQPSEELLRKAAEYITDSKLMPIVSTDAVYRQTFFKEKLWRQKGAVGVDMETSALLSVGAYLNINIVSILIASDKHPLNEHDHSWKWTMTKEKRYEFFRKCLKFAESI